MAAAPVLPMVSVEEYLRTEYEPYCEYVDGELKPKSMPGRDHAILQKWLLFALAKPETEFGLFVLPERHIRISPTRVRIPDLAAFTEDDPSPAAAVPPLLTIEIVSPDETWGEVMAKKDDHLAMGVATVLIVDPERGTVFVARKDEPLYQAGKPVSVRIDVPERGSFMIEFDDLFHRLSGLRH